MQSRSPTSPVSVKRHPERGAYDRATIDAILDDGLVCHVGFVHDGAPFVIPTLHARDGDRIYLHGSPVSRMLRHLAGGADVCLTVTLIDGLVLARSAFNHSMNYRSVMVFGRAHLIEDAGEKLHALEVITEHVMPGRWRDVRPPDARELDATVVLSLTLEQASAKLRSGPPADDKRDLGLDVWAGVLPVHLQAGAPEADAHVPAGVAAPENVSSYRPGGTAGTR